MLNMTGMVQAPPGKWSVLMKPVGRRKRGGVLQPEFETTVVASNKEMVAALARQEAIANGFSDYAITKITEQK